MTYNDLKTQQIMENIGLWHCEQRHHSDQRDLFKNQSSRQSKLTKEYMKTSKRAWEARKKLGKDPAGKKGQEIWDGPGTTYVPHQDYVYKINRLQISKSYQK